MSITLEIPDEIIEPLKIPNDQVEKVLKRELGFLLYKEGYASMGVSRRLGGLSKWEFIEGLGKRDIERHYSEKELEEDIKYAKNNK